MMRFGILLAVALAAGISPAAAPFRLPVGATMAEAKAEGSGWRGAGGLSVPFVQARARLMSSVTASGWRFLHEIPLGTRNDRLLLAFSRADLELTLMVWRVAVDKSGFSYGISKSDR